MQTTSTIADGPSTDSALMTSTHTIAGLIGTLPELHFYQLLHQDNIVETRPIEELRALWETSREHFSQSPPPAVPSTAITYLPKALERSELEVRQCPTYVQYFQGYRFCLVPVHQLITPQWYINLDYLQTLQQIVPEPGQLEQALAFACDEGGSELAEPAVSNVAGLPSLAFRVPTYRDLAIALSPFQPFQAQRIGPRKFTITTRAEVQLKPNYLHAAKIGSRLIILNGVHRSLALMQAGWKAIPCLVRDFPNARSLIEVGFPPNQLGVLPDQLLFRESRSAYLSDYLDPLTAPHFQQRDMDALWQFICQMQLNKQPMSKTA